MIQPYNLQRYLDAQENVYARAYSEIEHGHKQGHWMWFIFRQIIGLGQNETSKYYAIANLEEATMFLGHPILGSRLIAICEMLCKSKSNEALKTFGSPDDQKLFSSITLFDQITKSHTIVKKVLIEYFEGKHDIRTLKILKT